MAYYGTQSYLEDKDFTDWLKAILRGDLGLEWMKSDGEAVRCTVPAGRFSYANINVGAYGYETLPAYIRLNRSLAPRGARRLEALSESLDHSEALAAGLLGSPEVLEPLIVLTGQGRTAAGVAAVRAGLQTTMADYFVRCDKAGLAERSGRSQLTIFLQHLSFI
jgi:hypothetical protein